ncbi:MAG: hypothetical protein ACTSPQ_21920 [Candidatus Helarchaeota archaeon]
MKAKGLNQKAELGSNAAPKGFGIVVMHHSPAPAPPRNNRNGCD